MNVSVTGEIGEVGEVVALTDNLHQALRSVLSVRPEVIRLTLMTLLAEGHLLLEDVPGVGKTTVAKALAQSIAGTVGRVQFTPDLLPSDLTGISIYRAENHDFEFRPGPIFANIVIGDEINRASPKTQSALLECMQEAKATVDGTTYHLPSPFMVVATQNPVEMEGTYPLPEAQRDRFMTQLSVGYPDSSAELEMLDRQDAADPLARLGPVAGVAEIRAAVAAARAVHASAAAKQYVIDLANATRHHPAVLVGASPRASIQLLRAAKALAAMSGRPHVLPDDVQHLALPVLAHRLILRTEARVHGHSSAAVIEEVMASTPVPAGPRR